MTLGYQVPDPGFYEFTTSCWELGWKNFHWRVIPFLPCLVGSWSITYYL